MGAKRTGLTLLILLLAILLSGIPGSAQTQSLGDCVTDQNGRFPSSNLRCDLRIPNNTAPGEYNLVGRCPNGVGAGPGGYPPATGNSTGALGVSSNRVNPGQVITASGEGCAPNSIVSFTLERIGAAFSLGDVFTGAAYAQSGTRTLTARMTVVPVSRAAATSTDGTSGSTGASGSTGGTASRGTLSRTGLPVLPFLAAGLSALALGGSLVLAGRRRTRRQSAT